MTFKEPVTIPKPVRELLGVKLGTEVASGARKGVLPDLFNETHAAAVERLSLPPCEQSTLQPVSSNVMAFNSVASVHDTILPVDGGWWAGY